MITKLSCVIVTFLVLLAAPAWGGELQTGVLPLNVDAVTPIRLEADEEFRIEGVVEAGDTVVVVLRIDDMASWSYASRFNGERILPPGPFRWTIAAKGLHTAEGRTLDHSQLRRFIFFVDRGKGRVTITKFTHEKAIRLPGQAKGYSLGAETAEVPAGFERITPTDPRAEGRKIYAIHRPAPDPLVASGLRGIEKLRLPWSGGRANVTIWTEDPGEWELLLLPFASLRWSRCEVRGRLRARGAWGISFMPRQITGLLDIQLHDIS